MVGQRVAHYRVLSEVGRGGMGVVYLAEDEGLERRVALKFIRADAVGTPTPTRGSSAKPGPRASSTIPTSRRFTRSASGRASTSSRWPGTTARRSPNGSRADRVPQDEAVDDPHAGRRRTRARSCRRDRPPRSEAGQHPAHPRRRRQDSRLRPGRVQRAECADPGAAHRRREHDGHARLHGARAVPRCAASTRGPTCGRWA